MPGSTPRGITYPLLGEEANIEAFATSFDTVDEIYGKSVTDVAALDALSTNLFAGREVYVNSEKARAVYDGTVWNGVWRDYSPTLGWTNTTVTSAKYRRIGDEVTVKVLLTLSGTPTGTFTIQLPSTSADTVNRSGHGTALLIDGASDTTRRAGTVILPSTTTASIIVDSLTSSALVSTTVPWTWASTDTIGVTFSYNEA